MQNNGRTEDGGKREDTQKISARLVSGASEVGLAPPHESDDTLLAMLRDLRSIARGNGAATESGGDGSGRSKKHLGFTALISVIAAMGSGFAGYQVLQSTVERHEVQITEHEAKRMHPASEAAFVEVNGKIEELSGQVRTLGDQQRTIAEGIDELKRENIESLKHRLERAERELRRREP